MNLSLFINGEIHQFGHTLSLKECLSFLGYTDENPVATAVNEIFIPCQNRAETVLQNGDRVEILSAMQGG